MVGARQSLLDQLTQDHWLAANETVDRVWVDPGSTGDLGDCGRPISLRQEQPPGFIDDALARGGRLQPTLSSVIGASSAGGFDVLHHSIRSHIGSILFRVPAFRNSVRSVSEHVTTHTDPSDIIPSLMAPVKPHVIVLFGATGDLARRKLLPGLLHLSLAGLVSDCRIVGTSLDDFDDETFRTFARKACDEFSSRTISDSQWTAFASKLRYVPQGKGPVGLAAKVAAAEKELGGEPRRLHYLSVPPSAARIVVNTLSEAHLVERSRIIMEKPFGTDLATAAEEHVPSRIRHRPARA